MYCPMTVTFEKLYFSSNKFCLLINFEKEQEAVAVCGPREGVSNPFLLQDSRSQTAEKPSAKIITTSRPVKASEELADDGVLKI